MFGSDGQEKMSGASGFDWANYKFATSGVTADMVLQIDRSTPATPSTSTLLDLFSFVEGLSGSAFADVLRGTDAVFTDFAVAGAQGSVLDAAGIARIEACRTCSGQGCDVICGRQHHPRRRGQRHHRGPRRQRHHRRRPLARRARERARCGQSRRRDPQRRQHPGARPGHALGCDQSEPARDRARDQDVTGAGLRHRDVLRRSRELLGRHRLRRHRHGHG